MTQVIGLLGYERLASLVATFNFAFTREEFIFVRHGETEGNRTRIFQVPQIPLNAAGEAQARAAAATLASTRIGRLVASPMARAWRTASLIGAQHQMTPEADGALAERYYVNLWDTPVPTGGLDWGEDLPGSETLAAFVSRVGHSLARILADDADGETVIVAHGGILLVLCAATGVSLGDNLRRNAVPLRFARANGAWTSAPYERA